MPENRQHVNDVSLCNIKSKELYFYFPLYGIFPFFLLAYFTFALGRGF